MSREGVATLQGFAWYVRKRPGDGSPDTEGHPLDGVESKCQPLCWPIGPEESRVHNHDSRSAFLVIIPALTFLTFGPPEVGQGWEVEPAELDGFSTEDGRIRIVGMERHQTGWVNVAECEFGVSPGHRWSRGRRLDVLPGAGRKGPPARRAREPVWAEYGLGESS